MSTENRPYNKENLLDLFEKIATVADLNCSDAAFSIDQDLSFIAIDAFLKENCDNLIICPDMQTAEALMMDLQTWLDLKGVKNKIHHEYFLLMLD